MTSIYQHDATQDYSGRSWSISCRATVLVYWAVRRQHMNEGLHHALQQQSAQRRLYTVWRGEGPRPNLVVHHDGVKWIQKLNFWRIQLGSDQWQRQWVKLEIIPTPIHQYQMRLKDDSESERCRDQRYRMQNSGPEDPEWYTFRSSTAFNSLCLIIPSLLPYRSSDCADSKLVFVCCLTVHQHYLGH